MKLTKKKPLLIPEGEHGVSIKKIAKGKPVKGKYGMIDRLNFEFYCQDSDLTIFQNVLVMFSNEALLTQIFEAVLGEVPEIPETDDLIGKSLTITVTHNTRAGRTFANVTQARPIENEVLPFSEEEYDEDITTEVAERILED